MKRIILIISISVFSYHLFAQNTVDQVLAEVEKNNTTLIAIRKSVDAEKIGNKTGIFLQNPEVAFNYLWGSPSVIGTRTDFSVSQTFDFPTAYGFRNQISDLKNEQKELEYEKQLMDIRLKTSLICFDLIYANALQEKLTKRVGYAQSIAKSYQQKFEAGETNILEYNKAQLNLLNISKELESIEIERNALLSELTGLNGGQTIDFTRKVFQITELPDDFEQWYLLAEQKNQAFGWLKKEIEIGQKQTGLNRAMSLPKLQTGYMSESVVGQQFQGVTVGLTIPLWENKNKVKYAEANSQALESIAADNKIQFYNHLKAVHTKTIALQKNVSEYRSNLLSYDSSELSKKALDQGEISLIEYLMDFSLYYESLNNLLELERNLNKTMAELKRYM
ncbi:MAG: TolC family protein [Prolixibacteraceae bacterium]|nr:TolC family protein [Prolixibacteraceae bacterium]